MAHLSAVLVTLVLGAWCGAMMLLVRRMDRTRRDRVSPTVARDISPNKHRGFRRKRQLAAR
jgi:hypothetical protein